MAFRKRISRANPSRCHMLQESLRYAMEALEPRLQLSVSLSLSGTQTITPGSVVNASADDDAWQSEMSVAVNPINPLNLVGFMHHVDRDTSDSNQMGVVYTMDGGATWNTNVVDGNDDGLGTGLTRTDPTLTFDSLGRLYICYGFVSTTATYRLMVAVDAEDGGASFEQFTEVDSVVGGGGIDKWLMTSGLDPISEGPAVYIAYLNVSTQKVVVAGSNDGGETFTAPMQVSDITQQGLFACPAVTANGELYVSWNGNADRVLIDRDVNGLFDAPTPNDFGEDKTFRTLANGDFFKYPVNAAPDRGIHTGPVLAVDRSGGTYNGRLYVAFCELNSSTMGEQNSNLKIAYEDRTDWETNWNPTTVTIDSSSGTEFLPWVDVDQATGSVNVLYYTTDGDQSMGNEDVKMRMAVSLNGGVNWTLTDLTTIRSDENENGNEVEDSETDYLEYSGLDVHQGTAHGLFAFEPFGSGADQFDLEALYLNAAFVNAANTLTITGDDNPQAVNDTVVLRRHALNANYLEVLVNNVQQFAGRIDTIGQAIVNLGAGDDIIYVYDNFPFSLTINGGAGSDSIIVEGGSATNEISLDAGLDMEFLLVNDDDQGEARVVLTDSQVFGQLTIGTGGGVRIVPDGSLFVRAEAITISSGGFFDLADNDMIVDAVAYEFIEPLLISGYNGGQWNGSGIRSSLANSSMRALGIALASDLGVSTFAGQSVASNAVLLRYTFYGDADLSGHVNLADFNRLAGNFGQSGRRWFDGDFNFNGIVNLADFNLLASNFGSTDGPEVGEYYTYEELEKMLEEYQG